MDPTDVEKDGLLNNELGKPNPSHPSDHYSIGYHVQLKRYAIKNMDNKRSKIICGAHTGIRIADEKCEWRNMFVSYKELV